MFPHNQEIRTGATVVVTLGMPIVALAAPCRIVSVINEHTDGASPMGHCPAIPSKARRRSSFRSRRIRPFGSRSRRFHAPAIQSSGCRVP